MFPGVDKTLSLLEAKGFLMGLVTGNLEPIAHGKLASVGIDKYFKFGGFGSEALERSELVSNAVRKARKQFGFNEGGEVILFGDAPQDMQAALQGGATPVGVTTGIYGKEELQPAGATKIIAGIGDHEAVLAVLAPGSLTGSN